MEVPEGFGRVWGHFWRVARGGALTFSELEAYQRLTGILFSPGDVELLLAMDSEYQAFVAEQMKAPQGGQGGENGN